MSEFWIIVLAMISTVFGVEIDNLDQAIRGEGQTEMLAPPTTLPPKQEEVRPPSGLSDCEEMNWYRIEAGLPEIFERIGWRESNCRNEDIVRTFCCHGYWQMYTSLHLKDHRLAPKMAACGVTSHYDLNSDTHEEKTKQACAAKALYDLNGTDPWVATRGY